MRARGPIFKSAGMILLPLALAGVNTISIGGICVDICKTYGHSMV
jgi:predicted benzoate:H+ symporter BenE